MRKSKILARSFLLARDFLASYALKNAATIQAFAALRKVGIVVLNFSLDPVRYISNRNPLIVKLNFAKIDHPLVSIVLPTYNHGQFIGEAINGILAQDYRNYELIIINDGSTDNTSKVLSTFKANKRIKIIEQENCGLPKALNIGFSIAEGDFFTWTSADNLLSQSAIGTLVFAANRDTDVGLFYSDFQAIDEAGLPLTDKNLWRIYDRDKIDKSVIRLKSSEKLYRQIPVNFVGPYFLFRASLAKQLQAYSNMPGIEDWDYWLRMQFLTKFEHVKTSGLNYKYRVHLNSLSGSLDILGNILRTIEAVSKIVNLRMSTSSLEVKLDPIITEEVYSKLYLEPRREKK